MRRTPAKQHDTRAHGKQRRRCQPRNSYTGIGDERLGIGAIAVLRNTSRTGAARFGSSRRLPQTSTAFLGSGRPIATGIGSFTTARFHGADRRINNLEGKIKRGSAIRGETEPIST